MQNRTIVAIATPSGVGGVGVVRLSGPLSPTITQRITGADPPPPRQAAFRRFQDSDGQTLDDGLVLHFPAPASYTGEDVAEWQCHGAPIILDHLVTLAIRAGAELARPGEFTERAFLNGKLDLAQAEAVADLIAANSLAAARAAARSLHGEFSNRVNTIAEDLTSLRVYVEAVIDFPEEEIDFLADGDVAQRISHLHNQVNALRTQAHQGVLLSDGIRIAICGRPNAGKSSLLNAMVGHAAAIVTDVPGTTRDVLRETITIKGMPVRLMDTAGLRETTETVEKIGTERARQAIADADVVIVVVDDTNFTSEDIAELRSEIPSGVPTVVVHNKVDLTGRATGNQGPSGVIGISALTGAGLDALRATLANRVGYQETEGVFAARRRHLTALDNTSEALADAAALLHDVPDTVLIAEELRIAHDRLGQITGRFTSEDLLGAIFSSFCIGK